MLHPTDQELILELDGELSGNQARRVQEHLKACWTCRSRRQELEGAIGSLIVARRESGHELPPADGPRALLKARLHEASGPRTYFSPAWALAGGAAALIAISLLIARALPVHRVKQHEGVVSVPDARLTPGAAVLVSRRSVCAGENAKNKMVPVAMQRKVFAAYGISGAEPLEYEVDYLITPALGGADDIHNLWPQSHYSTVWNADVKDALEDRLRQMVCEGSLDLTEAQHEIAVNWVDAYKKYFHTNSPLPQHQRP